MTRNHLLLIFALGLSGLGSAVAKQAPARAVSEILPVLPTQIFSPAARTTQDDQVLSWYQISEAAVGATPESQARTFLLRHAEVLGLGGADRLEHLHTRRGPAGSNVHFVHYLGEVPVYRSRYVVHISPQNRITQFARSHAAPGELNVSEPALTVQQARERALAALGPAPEYRGDMASTLVAYPRGKGSVLAWQVQVQAQKPRGDWDVVVDARNGAILALWDRAAYLHDEEHPANGSVFDPDPLSSSGTVYGQPITDNEDANYLEINAQVQLRELGELRKERSFYWLSSPWAELVDFEAPQLGLFGQPGSDFIFNRNEDGFEAVNVFWHVQQSMQYINETLGLELMPYQYEGGVRFDPHGLDGDDNSFYSPASGQLAFGEGCVDDAEDADVVWHELGHGLHDWVTFGGLSNYIDGLSEGFGDYWAQSYSRSLGQWQPDSEQYQWVFDWDGHNECWGGRVTNYALPWPAGITPFPAIHTGGQIWSTCLMKIYDQIGREKTDLMVLEGLAMTHTLSTQNDAANAAYQAAIDMGYDSGELDVIQSEFAACGYLVQEGWPLLLAPQADQPPESAEQEEPAAGRSNSAAKAGGAVGLWCLLLGGVLLRRRRAVR